MSNQTKLPRTKWIMYSLLLIIIYIAGRAVVYHELLSTGLAGGLIIGFGVGTIYNQYKVLETKKVLETPN